MNTVPYPPQRQLSVGEVLDLSFRIYRVTLVRCLLYATCGVIGGQLAGIYALLKGRTLGRGEGAVEGMLAQLRDSTFVSLYVFGLLLTLIIAAVVVLCYALVAISCAQTILLVDGAGPAASLARSWRLTSGSFWRLSIIYTVALIVLLALYAVIAAVAGFLAALFAHGDVAMVTAFAQVIGIILGALATPFYGALALAVLADLKVRKEGADLAQRISATA